MGILSSAEQTPWNHRDSAALPGEGRGEGGGGEERGKGEGERKGGRVERGEEGGGGGGGGG